MSGPTQTIKVLIALQGFTVAIVLGEKLCGPYFILNEYIEPRIYNREIAGKKVDVTYKFDLRSNRSSYEDKRVFADFEFHRDVGPIGIRYELLWDMGNDNWISQGFAIDIPNACKTGYGIKHFLKHFSGTIDRNSCSIKAGKYKFTNWTVEDELQERFKELYYKRYKIKICFSDHPGFTDCFMKFDVVASIKDQKLKKKGNQKPSGKK